MSESVLPVTLFVFVSVKEKWNSVRSKVPSASKTSVIDQRSRPSMTTSNAYPYGEHRMAEPYGPPKSVAHALRPGRGLGNDRRMRARADTIANASDDHFLSLLGHVARHASKGRC